MLIVFFLLFFKLTSFSYFSKYGKTKCVESSCYGLNAQCSSFSEVSNKYNRHLESHMIMRVLIRFEGISAAIDECTDFSP